MWYTRRPANTSLWTPAHGRRAGHRGDRSAVLVCLSRAPRPDPPRQCRGPGDHDDGARRARHRADGAPCAACVPPARSDGVAAAIITATHDGDDLRRWSLRVPAGALASASPDLRPAHQPVDPPPGCRGALRPGPHTTAGPRRSHAGSPPTLVRVVEAGHTWDHESRSRLGPKNTRRDQLILRAKPQPTGARGCGDDVWWSRLAQPNPHGWTAPEAPPPQVPGVDATERGRRSEGARR
jgi:hypothetical protein